VVAVVLGEGGSGGALGIGVADRILMMENAYYSVISPEGCAAILWKHRKHGPEAAEAMKIAAPDLAGLGLIDEVVPEPEGGAHHDHEAAAANLGAAVSRQLEALCELPMDELLEQRYQKYRTTGEWMEL
jgi:acetyl-CoA carboxylase carboxyl transferase subunit alpha